MAKFTINLETSLLRGTVKFDFALGGVTIAKPELAEVPAPTFHGGFVPGDGAVDGEDLRIDHDDEDFDYFDYFDYFDDGSEEDPDYWVDPVRSNDMDLKAATSASGAVRDLDAYVGTLDDLQTDVLGTIQTPEAGWASGPETPKSPAGLAILTDEQKRELHAETWNNDDVKELAELSQTPPAVWEVERDGELVASALDSMFVEGQLSLLEPQRGCPCYPALDGSQGFEALRSDEESVEEFGRCSLCPAPRGQGY